MSFEVPDIPEDSSRETEIAVRVAALAGRLAVEKRAIVWDTDGQPEDVAQHSFMIGLTARTLAAELEPSLNADHVASLALIHDAVEAYAGDTPTYNIDKSGLDQKAQREAAGLARLREDYRTTTPSLVVLVDEYEAQLTPESRFVRLIDKAGPALTYVIGNSTHISADGKIADDLREYWQRKEGTLRDQYPEYEQYLQMCRELVEIAAAQLAEAGIVPD